MATEPSPTADATRLTDSCRTSPTARTRGKLVSSGKGLRVSGHWWFSFSEVRSGKHKSVVVSIYLWRQPIGVRLGPNGHEEPVRLDLLHDVACAVAKH